MCSCEISETKWKKAKIVKSFKKANKIKHFFRIEVKFRFYFRFKAKIFASKKRF